MTRERLPLGVYALTLTIFCLGTSEFMIAGLLPRWPPTCTPASLPSAT